MGDNLRHEALHAIKWSYISVIRSARMQIIYTAVMARLLESKAFGLAAMGNVFLRFGNYFARMGR